MLVYYMSTHSETTGLVHTWFSEVGHAFYIFSHIPNLYNSLSSYPTYIRYTFIYLWQHQGWFGGSKLAFVLLEDTLLRCFAVSKTDAGIDFTVGKKLILYESATFRNQHEVCCRTNQQLILIMQLYLLYLDSKWVQVDSWKLYWSNLTSKFKKLY